MFIDRKCPSDRRQPSIKFKGPRVTKSPNLKRIKRISLAPTVHWINMSKKSKVAQILIPSNFAFIGDVDPMHHLGARANFLVCVHASA